MGIKPDRYTVSISCSEARKAFAMMDQLGVHVCSEEVRFGTSLEVCLHLHERRRLQSCTSPMRWRSTAAISDDVHRRSQRLEEGLCLVWLL